VIRPLKDDVQFLKEVDISPTETIGWFGIEKAKDGYNLHVYNARHGEKMLTDFETQKRSHFVQEHDTRIPIVQDIIDIFKIGDEDMSEDMDIVIPRGKYEISYENPDYPLGIVVFEGVKFEKTGGVRACSGFYIAATDNFGSETKINGVYTTIETKIIQGNGHFFHHDGCVNPQVDTFCAGATIRATIQYMNSSGVFVDSKYTTQPFQSGSNFQLSYQRLLPIWSTTFGGSAPTIYTARMKYELVTPGNCNNTSPISYWTGINVQLALDI
jgi:hypothetical protein